MRIGGIKVETRTAYTFALSVALGTIGGIHITPTQYTAISIGAPFVVRGCVAAIVGGFSNPLGGCVGGIVLGRPAIGRRRLPRSRL